MKKKLLYLCVVCAFAAQSCRKTEVKAPAKGSNSSSILNLDNVGDYNTYQFFDAADGLSAQIGSFSLANGGTCNLTAYTATAHQQWRVTYMGNGYYTFMNMGSGKYIQSYNYNGTQVALQNSQDNKDDQLWFLYPAGSGYKVVNKANNLALTSNGTLGIIQMQPFVNKSSQVWNYNTVGPVAYRDDAVVNFFHRTQPSQGSIAFDQGSSIGLSDGRVLWVAEDSFDGTRVLADGNLMCGPFQYHNSILIQPATHSWDPNTIPNMTITTSTSGQPRQICNTQPGTGWSWPGVGAQVGSKVYMYCGEGQGLGATNQSIYELSETGTTNVWNSVRHLVTGMSNQTDVGFSLGIVKPNDGYVYAYGGKGVGFNASSVYVARFSESDPFTWTFWNGSTWTSSLSTAAVVASGQQNISIAYVRGKYIMMQLDEGFFCDPSQHNIYLSTSSSPTGPFTKPVKVFTIQDMYRGHLNRYYTPMLHPEEDNGKNELLLTYSVNFAACDTGDDCANNEMGSINYQVKGVRVPYSLIGM